MRRCVAPVTTLSLLAGLAAAQEGAVPAQPPPEVAEDTITVVGAVEQVGRIDEPRMVQGLDGEQLPAFSDDSIGQAVKRMPGISHTGPPGVVKDVRVRGMPKGYTQIRLDGVTGTGGNPDRQMQVDLLPPGLVGAVELSHIPYPEQDHGAIAGVVDVQIRPIPQGRLTGGSVAGSMHAGHLGHAVTGYAGDGTGDLGWLLGVGVQRSWLDKQDLETTVTATGAPKETKFKDEVSSTDEVDTLLRIQRRVSDALTLRLDLLGVAKREDKVKTEQKRNDVAGVFTEYKFQEPGEVKDNMLGQATTGATLRLGRHAIEATLTASTGSESKGGFTDRTDKYTNAGVYNGRDLVVKAGDDKTDRTWRLGLIHDWDIADGVHLRWGGEGRSDAHDEAKSERTIKFNATDAVTSHQVVQSDFTGDERMLAGHVRVDVDLGAHRLSPGLRVERVDRTIAASRQTETILVGPDTLVVLADADEGSATEVLPSLHYRMLLGEHLALRAAGARLVRRPKWGDVSPLVSGGTGSLATPYTVGNAALEPERGWAADAGVQLEVPALGVEGGITVFRRWLSDMIQNRTAQEGTDYYTRPQNVGDGWSQGIEADLRSPVGIAGLSLWGNGALLDSEVHDEAAGTTARMAEQPRWTATLGFDQRFGESGMTCGAAWNLRGRADKDEGAKTQTEEVFGILDAYVAWTWQRGWEARLSGANILDEGRRRIETNTANGDVTTRDEDSSPTVALTIAGEW